MKIAIISWGSLISSGISRGLLVNTPFKEGGPMLPIEFSRISQAGERAGCLTLVLDEINGVNIPTQYSESKYRNLDQALTNLREVENINIKFKYTVGYVNLISGNEREWARLNHPISCDIIRNWARINDFDAVIWTSLLANFKRITGIPYSVDAAINYVNDTSEPIKSRATDYILNAPPQAQTPFRIHFTKYLCEGPENHDEVRQMDAGELALLKILNKVRQHR